MGVQGQCCLEVRALNAVDEGLFQSGVDCDRFDQTGFGFVLSDEIRAESSADLFGEFVGIFGDRGEVRNGFENERSRL